ncbi:molybdate ABC transporter substrate-binding protein [Georgenia sp. 311]|uniref:molybdate ABC transporter substrate-binding protein n=1 Tax=Georgenia sp. 311 TaxID=2585134 RepID=UPI0011122215|nr:molybdate ABC transporter substrate-binding protein [Georgenia sp. 311]TNC16885.1 molybdate ABC transporter substrate-binding protein [Georgenia sp. 311]
MSRPRALAAATLAVLALGACGATDGGAEQATTPSGELTVYAAASLRTVYEELGELFTAEHPGAEVTFSFAGSADLVAQLDAGAPADVLATADEATMARAVEDGTVAGQPQVVAENALTLVVPAGNPGGVTGLDAAGLAGADLVVCAPQVPCGAAAQALAADLGLTLTPVSEENSVTDVLGKVTSGQAEAGLVYSTDAVVAGDAVEVVPVEGAEEVVNRYPVAVTTGTDQEALAQAWIDLVSGPVGQEVLAAAGFGTP